MESDKNISQVIRMAIADAVEYGKDKAKELIEENLESAGCEDWNIVISNFAADVEVDFTLNGKSTHMSFGFTEVKGD